MPEFDRTDLLETGAYTFYLLKDPDIFPELN